MDVLLEGLLFPESPRWHDGALWLADWAANEVLRLGDSGPQVVATVPSFPMCIDFLPDGRLLVVDSAHQRLLRQEADGALVTHADLSALSTKPWNEVVADARGNAYVNGIGFDFPGGEVGPGLIALVSEDGNTTEVAGDLAFPNGMALTPQGELLVAESYAGRLTAFTIEADGSLSGRRVWADLGDAAPDGICVDAAVQHVDRIARVEGQQRGRALTQPWAEDRVREVGPRLRQPADPEPLGGRARAQSRHLGEDEPHPVAALVARLQLGDDRPVRRGLRLHEALEVERGAHAPGAGAGRAST
jgi:hypothetical protein